MRDEHAACLRLAARTLGPGAIIDEAGSAARGGAGAIGVTVCLAERAGEPWTSFEVATAPGPLALHLSPASPVDGAFTRARLAIDVKTGDPEFDRRFRLEAAPADVARALLDASVRGKLLALHPVELEIEGALLRVAKPGWLADGAQMRLGVDAVAAIAAGIGKAFEDATLAGHDPGASYRTAGTDTRTELARRGAAELAILDAVRRRRRAVIFIGSCILMAVVIALSTLFPDP